MTKRSSASGEDIDLASDVLVIGGGPAGAWAAIAAAEAGARVTLADKGRVGSSGATACANTAVIHVAPDSAPRATVVARRLAMGMGLVQTDHVELVLDETYRALFRLAEWGYAFPHDDRGIVYRGSLRGPDYMQLLRRRLQKLGVRLLDHCPALELIASEGIVAGAAGVQRVSGAPWRVRAGAVVIATGGCAFMSKALGTYGLTGDGLLMAAEAGASLSGMEFSGQYGISHSAATVTKNLLYSWATFTDEAGNVLEGEDIFELLARHLPNGRVYARIDKASSAIQAGLRSGQPNIFLALDRQGIDPFTQRFPVTLRYEGTVRGVGGLEIVADCATAAPGLFAAGDAASREDLVGATSGGGGPNATWAIASGAWAGRAAQAFAARLGGQANTRPAHGLGGAGMDGAEAGVADRILEVQREMFPIERNFIRDAPTIRHSLARLDGVWKSFGARRFDRDPKMAGALRAREAAAMAATGRWIYASALERRESRGIHRRRDCPALDPGQTHRLTTGGLDAISVRAGEAAR
jgi:succinate dehydrogenase/fumarate reductase flavoprotein subunit